MLLMSMHCRRRQLSNGIRAAGAFLQHPSSQPEQSSGGGGARSSGFRGRRGGGVGWGLSETLAFPNLSS